MKFLFDLFPIILFFIAYKSYDIYVATAVAIVASFLQVGLFWLKHKRVEKMHIITLVLIAVLGGATLVLQDPDFIKWKPTVVNWLFAIVFLGSHFIGQKPIIKRMLDGNIELPEFVWSRLSVGWVLFFIAMGVVNLYVAFNYDEDTWVNFKLFGMMGLTIIFILAQALYLGRHMQPVEVEEKDKEQP